MIATILTAAAVYVATGIDYLGFCCKVRKNITNYHFNMVVFP